MDFTGSNRLINKLKFPGGKLYSERRKVLINKKGENKQRNIQFNFLLKSELVSVVPFVGE